MSTSIRNAVAIAIAVLRIVGVFASETHVTGFAQEKTYFELPEFDETLEALSDEDIKDRLLETPEDVTLRRLSAKRLLEAGSLNACIAQLASAIQLRPREAQLYFERGQAHLLANDFVFALQDINEALALEPQRMDASRLRACIHSQMGNVDAAIEDCDMLLRRTISASNYTVRGLVFLRANETQRCISDLDAALEIDQRNWWAYRFRAIARTILRQYELAIGDAEQMINLRPRDVDSYEFLTEIFLAQGTKTKAIETISKLLSFLNRDTTEYYLCRLKLRFLKQEYAELIIDSGEAMGRGHINTHIWLLRGRAEFALNKVDAAIGDYSEAIRLAPLNADAYFHRAGAWLRQNHLDLALADSTMAVKICETAQSLNLRGRVKLFRADLNGALMDLTASIRFEPKRAESYLYRGEALRLMDRPADARHDIESAIQLGENSARAYVYLSAVHCSAHVYELALAAAENAISLDPSYASAHIQRAHVLERLNRERDAIDAYGEVLKLDSSQIQILLSRGRLYRKLGEYQKAMDDFRNVGQIDRDSCDALLESATTWHELGNTTRALEDREEAVRQHPLNPEALRSLSWSLAADADEDNRDGPRALKLARDADRLNTRRNWYFQLTIAVALGECGEFGEAIRILDGLDDRLDTEIEKSRVKRLIALFEDGKPYHEQPKSK